MNKRKPKILYLTHQYDNKGGVEEFLRSLEKHHAEDFDTSILYPHEDSLILRQQGKKLVSLPAQVKTGIDPIRATQTEISLDLAIQIVNPDLIHIVHLFNWPSSAALICLQFGLPVVASFHDYYLLTPEFTMQNCDNLDSLVTKDYAERIFGADISEFLIARRDYFKNLISNFSARIVPSDYLENQLKSVFPVEFKKIEYGIEDFNYLEGTQSVKAKFGYLGRFLPQKGVEILLEAFSKLHSNYPDVELYMYGGEFKEDPPGIKSFGQYERKDLTKIISSFEVGIIPSIFAETYCMTASELWHGKRTFIASEIGALKERIKHKNNAYLFNSGSAAELAEAMEWFINNEDWKTWELPTPPLADEMSVKYKLLYQELIND